MIIGIIVDDDKVDIFERRLNDGGFTFTKHRGIVAGTTDFAVTVDEVTTDEMADLRVLIDACQAEAAYRKVTRDEIPRR